MQRCTLKSVRLGSTPTHRTLQSPTQRESCPIQVLLLNHSGSYYAPAPLRSMTLLYSWKRGDSKLARCISLQQLSHAVRTYLPTQAPSPHKRFGDKEEIFVSTCFDPHINLTHSIPCSSLYTIVIDYITSHCLHA